MGWQTAARSKAKRACSEFSTAVLCGTVLSAGTCGPATAAEGRGVRGPPAQPPAGPSPLPAPRAPQPWTPAAGLLTAMSLTGSVTVGRWHTAAA